MPPELPDYVKNAIKKEPKLPDYVLKAVSGETSEPQDVEYPPPSQPISTGGFVKTALEGNELGEPPSDGVSFYDRYIRGSVQGAADIASVYPVAENAANLVTSAYGVPISGLVGLLSSVVGAAVGSAQGKNPIDEGLKYGTAAMEKTQDLLIAKPFTERGKRLQSGVSYPFEKLHEVAGKAGEATLGATGSPVAATAVHTAIEAAPVIAGGSRYLKTATPQKINFQINKTIDQGIAKAIKPSTAKKSSLTALDAYKRSTRTAVKEIIRNKDNINLMDESGAITKGLPTNLRQTLDAIDQTKKKIFNEYDSLARVTGNKVKVDLSKISKELDTITTNKTLMDFSPETIEYAKSMQEVLSGRKHYTALETQEAIQYLNKTLEDFYKTRDMNVYGKVRINSMIANILRKELDTSIQRSTGKDYAALKSRYGSLRNLERDVTKRTIIDSRKAPKGLVDFSDIYTGYHVISGLLRNEPTVAVSGALAKVIANRMRALNDPNKIISKMFKETDSLINTRNELLSR
jgi:hypothetical protein